MSVFRVYEIDSGSYKQKIIQPNYFDFVKNKNSDEKIKTSCNSGNSTHLKIEIQH